MRYLTEDPLLLCVTLAVAAVFLAWTGMQRGQKKLLRAATVFGVLAVIPPTIDALVQTDRETIRESLDDLAEAVVDGSVSRAVSFVKGDGANDAREKIRRGLEMIDVHEGLRIKAVQVEVDGDTATCDFRANGTVDVKGVAMGRHAASRWVLAWERAGEDDWKVTSVTRINPVTGAEMGTFSAE